ncbi:hypothetical protein DFH09DRAFT_1088075 [Mycena vulgaris]|nr:hypothetical protein DFH09DRAFT_1088075 [Mycena vulgaris]
MVRSKHNAKVSTYSPSGAQAAGSGKYPNLDRVDGGQRSPPVGAPLPTSGIFYYRFRLVGPIPKRKRNGWSFTNEKIESKERGTLSEVAVVDMEGLSNEHL